MEYNFTKEDIEKVEKFIQIKNKGYYCDGAQLTEVYNRVLNKRVSTTTCGSCLRQRVNELEQALNHYKKQQELAAMSGFTTVEDYKQEVEAINEELKDVKIKKIKGKK